MTSPSSNPVKWRALADAAVLGGILTALLGIAGVFTWFWLPPAPTAGPALATYAPTRTGQSRLMVELDSNGVPTTWASENIRVIPWLRLFNELGFATSAGISQTYLDSESTGALTFEQARTGATIIGVSRRELSARAEISASTIYYLTEPRGLLLVGSLPSDRASPRFFDPPVVILPPDPNVGRAWSSSGQLGSMPYRWAATVASRGPLSIRAGDYDDCLQVQSQFELGQSSSPALQSTSRDWYCADLGITASESSTNGGPFIRSETAAPWDLPPATVSAAATDVTDVLTMSPDWTLQRFGDITQLGLAAAGTFAPVWVDGDPSLVLAAEQGGDLVAFRAESDLPTIEWRFHPGGSIYGAPAVDPATGRIFFGSSDKVIYALDRRGLFLWSFITRDTVVTTPVVAEDLVIVAGEDHMVYALEAATGALRWTLVGSGPIASSPTLLGETIVFASDDQGVYGVDVRTGENVWSFAAPAPVEAATVGVDASNVLIASRDGSLTLLDIGTCPSGCAPTWTVSAGSTIRRAPAVLGNRAFVVDDDGALNAIELEQGKRLWTRELEQFVGPPLALDDSLIVARKNGAIVQISPEGLTLTSWDINGARSPLDADRQLTFGPSAGGGSVWFADRVSVVWRLGRLKSSSAAPLHPDWLISRSRLRREFDRFLSTPLNWEGGIILLDTLKRVSTLNPDTGALTPIGELPGADALGYIEPTVAGDRIVAIAGNALVSLRLTDGSEPWQVTAEGRSWRPPAASDSTIAWVTGLNNGNTALLHVLDSISGAERWTAPLENFFVPGGAVIAGSRVIVSSPPSAFEMSSGRSLWSADIPGLGLGGPGLDPDGDTVYVGYANTETVVNGLAAIDSATGRVRWTSQLTDALLAVHDAPRVSGNTVVVPLSSGVIEGLDRESGVRRWSYQPPDARMGSIEVNSGLVWLMTESARVLALDAQSGTLVARYSDILQNVGSPTYLQRPLALENRIIVPMGDVVLGLDAPAR